MPLARYLSVVGGALLALLFILDACLPELPAAAKARVYPPVIHIYSDKKWPERIVYDTSLETIVPLVAASGRVAAAPETIAEAASGTEVREAFAMLPPSFDRSLAPLPKMQVKPRKHRKTAMKRAAAPMIAMVRNQQYGWLGRNGW